MHRYRLTVSQRLLRLYILAMVKNFNPFPEPKKGKVRSALKKPAKSKTSGWKKVPYVRAKDAVQTQRMDRVAWKRKLADFLTPSDSALVKLLRQDHLLHDWAGRTCPRCQKGTLSKLQNKSGEGMPKHRCSRFGCQAYINPHHMHPIFVDGRGSGSTPLQTQAAMLFLLLNRVSHPAIHRILHVNHKAIEDMAKRLMTLRKHWVEEKEKTIIFGNSKQWIDVEADEATFSSKDLKDMAQDASKPIVWEQWCGIVAGGHPQTLVLHRLNPLTSARRAPGPGAIRKLEWKPLAKKHLKNRKVVLHTDKAKSYKLKLPGILHDQVRHCKKRVKVKGKWIWKMPTYVRVAKHKDPETGKMITTKGGTQIIDRTWRFIKERLQLNQSCKPGSSVLRTKLRSAQYEYWHRNSDLWVACGTVCAWHNAKFKAC